MTSDVLAPPQGPGMPGPKAAPQPQGWLEAWHVSPSTNRDYDFIDGLRGVAILLVLACHLIYVNPLSSNVILFVGGLFSAGRYGVTVFFALSGFLISWPFWRQKVNGSAKATPRGYAGRRFWKIYPPLALSILLLTPVYILLSHDWSFLKTAGQWLVGMPVLLPVSGELNPVMWSLAVEIEFYLLLPLLFLVLKRVSARTCLWLVPSIFAVIPITFRLFNYSRGASFTIHPQIDVHFPSLLDAFALGILVAGLDNMKLLRRRWARFADAGWFLLLISLGAAAWLTVFPVAGHTFEELVAGGVKLGAGLLLCYVADPQHPRARLLSARWLRWCGIISYEWYLFHQPIIMWARGQFGPTDGDILKYSWMALGSLVVGLAIAASVYRYYSLPLLRYGRARHKH